MPGLERLSDEEIGDILEKGGHYVDAQFAGNSEHRLLLDAQLEADQKVLEQVKREMIEEFETWLTDIQKNHSAWQAFKQKRLGRSKHRFLTTSGQEWTSEKPQP